MNTSLRHFLQRNALLREIAIDLGVRAYAHVLALSRATGTAFAEHAHLAELLHVLAALDEVEDLWLEIAERVLAAVRRHEENALADLGGRSDEIERCCEEFDRVVQEAHLRAQAVRAGERYDAAEFDLFLALARHALDSGDDIGRRHLGALLYERRMHRRWLTTREGQQLLRFKRRHRRRRRRARDRR